MVGDVLSVAGLEDLGVGLELAFQAGNLTGASVGSGASRNGWMK